MNKCEIKLRKSTEGFTLVELVVTMGVTAIMLAMLGTFLYFFIAINNDVNTYRSTYQNANNLAHVIGDFIDRRNDGRIEEPAAGETDILFKVNSEGTYYSISYDENNDILKVGTDGIFTSEDRFLSITSFWTPVPAGTTEQVRGTLRFEITYGPDRNTLSFLKAIF